MSDECTLCGREVGFEQSAGYIYYTQIPEYIRGCFLCEKCIERYEVEIGLVNNSPVKFKQ